MWGQCLRSYRPKVTKSYILCFSVALYLLDNGVFVLFLPHFPTFLSFIASIETGLHTASRCLYARYKAHKVLHLPIVYKYQGR